jgi:tRNA A-37 threonylcarbamoyl transferase component Bud32
MKLSALTGRSPALPLHLELGGDELRLDSLLRVLPGRRYVGRAQWRGRTVLAKLLVGDKAARHFSRELGGTHLLLEQGLETPKLLADGFREGEGGWLLFEFLESARSLDQAWREVVDQPPLSSAQEQVLGEALQAVAHLHRRGLWQADLHLDNLMRHDGRLYLIDGGAVQAETLGQPLSPELALANLGMFFAQLPAEFEAFAEPLLAHYHAINPAHALPLPALLAQATKVRRWRLRDYLKKVGRDCSLFAFRQGAFGLRAVWREDASLLAPLLHDPDAAIESGHRYKSGGTATVARVEAGGRPLVIKRYNIKGLAHWLGRCWRPSRAWHSWREGHRLEHLGIATPRPLAVLERRWLGLRGRAYLITENLAGDDIIARFGSGATLPPETELAVLERLFAALLRERISHGDLKGTNLIWDTGRWSLIDLDAARQHADARGFAKAHARDRARFLRNWPADSALYRLLDERLPRVPGTRPE